MVWLFHLLSDPKNLQNSISTGMLCPSQVSLGNYWQVTLWNKGGGRGAIASLIQLNAFLDEK